MGTLRELTSESKNVHLILSNSGLAEMYVYDELKKVCGATLDSIYQVETKADFKSMLELVNIQSYLSNKWLFVINYSKLKGMCKMNKGIFLVNTACYLVKVKNYGEFKEFKELYPACNDLYLSTIRRNDTMFLLQGYSLSQKLVDFVSTSYARDPEKIFKLKEQLDAGIEVESQRDVVKLIGASSGSINSFAFLLLAEPPQTEKGLSRVFKKRVQMSVDLINAYGVSTFKNYLTATVRDILYIKLLYTEGVIFKSIKNIPDCFDEKKLSKYNIYLQRIGNDIPYNRISRLYCMLRESGRWYSNRDLLDFLYKYYGGVSDAIVSKL